MWAPYLLRDGRIEEEGSGRSRARGRGGIGGRAIALHKEGGHQAISRSSRKP